VQEGSVSAKSVYAPIAYPGGGTTINSLQTQIGARGGNLEVLVPSYDAYGNPLTEAMFIEKSWKTEFTIADAIRRAGYVPIRVKVDIDSIAQAIQQYGAVIWEIQGHNNGTWLSSDPIPPSNSNPNEIWTHFMCSKGALVRDSLKTIAMFNSWGTSVGDNGVQYFTQQYIDSGYILDVFTFAKDSTNPQTNDFVWAGVRDWFNRVFHN
jgi:C1A family cysteine protease